MKKEIIEQIKKIKGVGTVTYNDSSFSGTFEAEKPRAVECTKSEQWDFIKKKNGLKAPFAKSHVLLCESGMHSINYQKDTTIIPFTQYLKDYNLQDEWEKYLIGEAEKKGFVKGVNCKGDIGGMSFVVDKVEYNRNVANCLINSSNGCIYNGDTGKWATIIPNEIELVKGEIYCWGDRIIRFKSMHKSGGVNLYSQIVKTNSVGFYLDSTGVGYSSSVNELTKATTKQKKRLIKKEIRNGYFHELQSKED